jgi:broad specificity phosphatase PhoE
MIPHLDENGGQSPARSRLARAMRGGDREVTILLVRHASTALNSEGGGDDRIRGWMDVPLSRQGRQEAEDLARKLCKDLDPDVVFTSDLRRAEDTAKAIANACGCEIVVSRGLRSWDMGNYTSRPTKDVAAEIDRHGCEQPDRAVPGGESFNTFRDRTFAGLQRVVDYGAAVPVVVTHRDVEKLLKTWLDKGQPATLECPKDFMRGSMPTGGIERVRIDTKALKAVATQKASPRA